MPNIDRKLYILLKILLSGLFWLVLSYLGIFGHTFSYTKLHFEVQPGSVPVYYLPIYYMKLLFERVVCFHCAQNHLRFIVLEILDSGLILSILSLLLSFPG